MDLEPKAEPMFHPDSCGYQPHRSALDAVATCRERCWRTDWVYVRPKLRVLGRKAILIPILLLHSFRHLGLMFLERGATITGLASEFARPAAYGDFLASILALIALFALLNNFGYGLVLVWTFCIEGSLDLLLAIALATKYDAVHFLGAAYWIPALWVPALLVTLFLTFSLPLQGRNSG